YRYVSHPVLHSFPTRRSSDLLVLGPGQEVAGVVAFVELAGKLADYAIDHAPALHRRPRGNRVGPALDVAIILDLQEFASVIGKRSEEHTSELQSRENLVCRLL